MTTAETMIWFLVTTAGVGLLLVVGMVVASHTYEKHR